MAERERLPMKASRRKIDFRQFDKALFLTPLVIFLIGLASLYSASGGTSVGLVVKQSLWMTLGVLVVFLIVRVSYFKLQDIAWPLYAASLFFLIAVLFTPARMGAHRWIDMGGFHIQPSEIAKLAVILALARFLAYERIEFISREKILIPFALLAIPFLLIVKEPDLGTALILLPTFLAMLYGWGLSVKALGLLVGLGLVASPFLFHLLKDYQKTRLLVFMNPNLDPLGAGYTIIQSKIAIGSGGFFGKGFMGGTQTQLRFVPEHHTDFIFAVISEEGGFLASLAVIALFVFMVVKGYSISGQTRDRFGSLLACGITTLIGSQALVNLGMSMGLLPVVGLPLPLVSYGGSSVIMTMAFVGLLLNIKIHKPLF